MSYDPADAALISAAPDLLAALRSLLDLVPMCEAGDPTRWLAACEARAALAKAEGES